MSSNLRVLRIPSFLTMSISLIRHSMDLNKLHVRGMSTLESYLWTVALRLGKSTPLFLLRELEGTCSSVIYMLMISYLVINTKFNREFAKLMTDKFEMSMMGELEFFLGFKVKQLIGGTFIN